MGMTIMCGADEKLRRYFENYGTVQEAFVSYDRYTGRPRGFGFVVFADAAVAEKVIQQQHTIDRREVEAKRALPKEESPVSKDQQAVVAGQRTKKIFVGGLAPTVDEDVFRLYFEEFGVVDDAVVMYDHDNKRPRGFGFITFAEEEAVDKVFAKGSLQALHDKQIEIKRAVPRDAMASSPRVPHRSPPGYFGSPYLARAPPGFREGPSAGRGVIGGGQGYGTSPYSRRSTGDVSGTSPGRMLYATTPPAIVTGIPAAIAAAAPPASSNMTPNSSGLENVSANGGGMTPTSTSIPGSAVGVQSPVGSIPIAMVHQQRQSTHDAQASQSQIRQQQHIQSPGASVVRGGYPLQHSTMQGAAGAHLASVESPAFALDSQAGNTLAELQQHVAINTMTEALEQLQVHQSQQPQQHQRPSQQSQQQTQHQTQSTIWS